MPAYKPGDVVVVPFPFTERLASKRRPALVCSSDSYNGATRHLVLAMITTSAHAKWPGDVAIATLVPPACRRRPPCAGSSSRWMLRWCCGEREY